LVDADKLAAMLAILFAETSAIGLRYYPVERVVADRVLVPVNTTWGSVQVKVSSYLGQVSNICPEYEDCRSLAEKAAVPLKIVWQQALTAAAHLYPLPEERKR
jgi:hypothetical protein